MFMYSLHNKALTTIRYYLEKYSNFNKPPPTTTTAPHINSASSKIVRFHNFSYSFLIKLISVVALCGLTKLLYILAQTAHLILIWYSKLCVYCFSTANEIVVGWKLCIHYTLMWVFLNSKFSLCLALANLIEF